MSSSSIIDKGIHSLVKLLGSVVRKVAGGDDPRSGLERLAIASALPVLTASLLWYTRTVVEVVDAEQSLWIQLWISQQKGAIRRVRRLFLLSPSLMRSHRDPYGLGQRKGGDEEEDEERMDRFAPPKLTFLPASSVPAWAWFGLWPVSISSIPRTQSHGYGGYTVTVWFAPLGMDIAKNLILEGRNMWLAKRAQKTEIWLHSSRGQHDIMTRRSRPLQSVIVEDGIKEALLADALRFLQSEEWYVRKGIPYRRGFLLHGPPGCGKTSLIQALAGSLRLPIVLIALGSKEIGDSDLFDALTRAPRDSIVLIEDVDCAFRTAESRDPYGRRPVTISGLLNAIDGVAAQEGRLIFLTTNYKEHLSEALVRPGRVDAQYFLGYASKAGAGELFDQFFPPSSQVNGADIGKELKAARDAFVAEVEDNVYSFAKLQGVLMQARDEPGLAAEGMRTLFGKDDVISHTDLEELKGSGGPSHDERQDIIQGRVAMLEHAAACKGSTPNKCSSRNCKNMKKYFRHAKRCQIKPKTDCKSCTFLIPLCSAHAKKCSITHSGGEVCPVPFCDRIREREIQDRASYMESLFEQQQQPQQPPKQPCEEERNKHSGPAKEEKLPN